MDENEIGRVVVDASIALHRTLGPGLLESVYSRCLAHALRRRHLLVEQELPIRVEYDGLVFPEAFRADLVVERKVIVEVKSVDRVAPAHRKQLQTYLKLSGCRLGFLLNFGADLMKEGITRTVNGLREDAATPRRSPRPRPSNPNQ